MRHLRNSDLVYRFENFEACIQNITSCYICIHYYISNHITNLQPKNTVFVKSSNTYSNKQTFLLDKILLGLLHFITSSLDRQYKDVHLKGKYYSF